MTIRLPVVQGADGLLQQLQAADTLGGVLTPTSVAATGTVGGSTFVSTTSVATLTDSASNVLFKADFTNRNVSAGNTGFAARTTGSNNVAIGYSSGVMTTSSIGSTLVGARAGGSISSGNQNTAVGSNALTALSTGSTNTCLGYNAGSALSGGCSYNTIIGNYSAVSTYSNYVVLSDGQGAARFMYNSGTAYTTIDCTAILPGADNVNSLGIASVRFSTVYAGTAAINTSDATLKDERAYGVTPQEMAWASSIRVVPYQFKDSVAAKGADRARLHFGVLAQEVYQAGISAGIADPFHYAFLCKDKLFSTGDDGIYQPVLDADGNQAVRWGIRYEELMMFLIACR